MFKALTKVGSMACRILELAGTPIDDRYSLCVCPCTGVFAIVEFSRKNPGETPAGGFRGPRRRWFDMLLKPAWHSTL